ncbi:hypothetical protein HK097_005030, partial [Rhizophlyctis rosea]
EQKPSCTASSTSISAAPPAPHAVPNSTTTASAGTAQSNAPSRSASTRSLNQAPVPQPPHVKSPSQTAGVQSIQQTANSNSVRAPSRSGSNASLSQKAGSGDGVGNLPSRTNSKESVKDLPGLPRSGSKGSVNKKVESADQGVRTGETVV